jgi:hypothetical protein
VLTLRADMPGVNGAAAVRIVRLDPATSFPQVIFTSFSGGAHCCTETKIATADATGTWRAVSGKTLDGDLGNELRDIDGDGSYELISFDNSFLYAFACYACSYAPTRIEKLIGSALKDVTRDPKYRKFLRERLSKMEARAQTQSEPNGYWGGWVAAKSLVGEVSDAWRKMLVSYDRQSEWVIEECLTNAPPGKCPDSQKRQLAFPEGLLKHLVRNGYITAEQRARLAATTPTSVDSAKQAVQSAFKNKIVPNDKDNTKLRQTVIAGDYALQVWGSDVMGGEALLKYDAAQARWVVLAMGGGAWSVDGLVDEGVPRAAATTLLAGVPH